MRHVAQVAQLISQLKYNQKLQQHSFKVRYTKILHKFIDFLLAEGLITNYEINENHYKIYPRYSKNVFSVFRSSKKISQTRKRHFITVEQLRKDHNQTGFYILSTNKGYLTSMDAIKKNVSGYLVCYIG